MYYEIVVDHYETANKCTIAPLRDRTDFRFVKVFGEGPLGPLSAPILLHPDGMCLSKWDRTVSVPALASVDCVWRRLPSIVRRLHWSVAPAIFAKIPTGFVTAYPRVGKKSAEPEGGLATVEALFTAAALLGNWDVSLLSRYYFGRLYVERNARRFVELTVDHAADEAQWPPPLRLERNSHLRKVNRGRLHRP